MRKSIPVRDPTSGRYPDRTFHQGVWKTDEQIANQRKYQARWKRERRRNDPEWAARELEYAKRAQKRKYHSDPEWAAEKMEKCRVASRRRVAVFGERNYAPTEGVAEFMRQLRDNYKESQ